MDAELPKIDARGLSCPLPVLKAQKRLKSMTVCARLEVLADDPRAPDDFREFVRASGNLMVEGEDCGFWHKFVLEKA